MRVGVLSGGISDLDWVQKMGFRSTQWLRFVECPAGPANADWKPFAEKLFSEAQSRDIRISAIGALYKNPLDPRQTEFATTVFRRAIDVAAHVGIQTVTGFAGGVIETQMNERGGNLVYKPLEDFLPQVVAFWEPLAKYAADHGVRIAFENCPQGQWHLPVMSYNILARPAMWERFFNATPCENLGIEWDASHLVCQLIDPVANVRKYGSRIFHVHAKDAFVDHALLATCGICHPGVTEHRFPGLGQSNWAEIIRALLCAGYDSDLNIEGWQDPVYRNHGTDPHTLQGQKLEETGLRIAKRTLEQYL